MTRAPHSAWDATNAGAVQGTHPQRGASPSVLDEYPFDQVLDVEAFEYAAETLGLCRQQRRVTYGRAARYTLREIAKHMRICEGTAKKYDISARERTHSRSAA